MGRNYAGILGSLAFMVVVARAVPQGTATSDALMNAWIALLVFSLLGFVIGRAAAWIVDEGLRGRLLEELAAKQIEVETTAGEPAQ